MALSGFIDQGVLDGVAEVERKLADEVKRAVQPIDPDTATVAELRDLVKQLLVQRAPEPLGEDTYSHLPVFFDKPECPRCKPFMESMLDSKTGLHHAVCHDCSGPIPHSIEFQNRGIESVTVDHMHLHTIPGRGGQIRVVVKRELCLPCFRLDWAKMHPDKPCDL